MQSKSIALTGALSKLKGEDASRLSAYAVSGSTILASANLDEDGKFKVSLPRQAAAAESQFALNVVIGPQGMTKTLEHVPNLVRIPVDRAQILKSERDFAVSTKGVTISDENLGIWWRWCYPYCVSGQLVGKDGCPVPGAEVTVYNVGFDWGGFSKTPEATVTTDQYGNFTACFTWCRCPICLCLWPCWPIWWDCWPWWWEWDILHVIESIEQNPIKGSGPVEGLQNAAVVMRPESHMLIRGQGFSNFRKADAIMGPDENRTAVIKRKLSNPIIRELFPWWWWCCDNPNIVFSATQGMNVILDENPATDTRWCLPDGSSVVLVANDLAISYCGGDQPPENGFAWTRVGNITVDKIHEGYADGFLGSDTSDLAFGGALDIFGGFAPSSQVLYYQVDAGLWTGDPARGGTPPLTSNPLTATLNNYIFIYDGGANLVFSGPVKMGPFSQNGYSNLFATEASRQGAPTGTGLDPFPPVPAGGFVLWAFEGMKVSTSSSVLIGGSATGAVDLTMTGFDNAFNPVALAPDGTLTLLVDNTGLPHAKINALTAWVSPGVKAILMGTGDCPAYDVGPNGFVTIDVTVDDANGHLWEYEVDAEWGHGNTATVSPPGNRGYAQNPLSFPAGPYQAPNTAQKSFGGGSETMSYTPTTSCCYEFRIRAGKRVTDGYGYPTLGDYDFWTISLNVS